MKKLLIPAFACTAAMLIACGDDSSSASSEAAESSSSVAAVSSSSDWVHEPIGEYVCVSAKDTATFLGYAFEGPDSAMEAIHYEYPRVDIDGVEKVCEEAKANKTKEQEVVCDSIVEISNSLKTMTFDSLKALMTEECKAGSIQNTVDLVDPDKAPENVPSSYPNYSTQCSLVNPLPSCLNPTKK